jgi:hypothetical protein
MFTLKDHPKEGEMEPSLNKTTEEKPLDPLRRASLYKYRSQFALA